MGVARAYTATLDSFRWPDSLQVWRAWIPPSDNTVHLVARRQWLVKVHDRWASWDITFIISASVLTPTALLAYQLRPSYFSFGRCQKASHLSLSLDMPSVDGSIYDSACLQFSHTKQEIHTAQTSVIRTMPTLSISCNMGLHLLQWQWLNKRRRFATTWPDRNYMAARVHITHWQAGMKAAFYRRLSSQISPYD